MGTSTAGTLIANAIAPGLLDRYLARNGYGSQQVDISDPARQSNLWSPVDGEGGHDFGAHGVFDGRSHNHDPQIWASQHRGRLGMLALALLSAVGAQLRKRSRNA